MESDIMSLSLMTVLKKKAQMPIKDFIDAASIWTLTAMNKKLLPDLALFVLVSLEIAYVTQLVDLCFFASNLRFSLKMLRS
jgi:hypothetical protein